MIINNVTLSLSLENGNHPVYIKLQTDGKILVGNASTLMRLNSDGSNDNSFGTNGLVGFPYPMNDVAIYPNGKIALAGGQSSFELVRLDTSGHLDNSFGSGGMVTTVANYPSCSYHTHTATSIALQPDGKILAGGYKRCCLLGDCQEFVLIRYKLNGSLDSSFSSDGRVTTYFPQFSARSHSSAITPDLKIVLAGYSYDYDYGGIARYHLGPMLAVNSLTNATNAFVISPNPTTGILNLSATKIENGAWDVEILDETGKSLYHETVNIRNNSFQKSISLTTFPNGLYFLRITGGNQRMAYKIAKGE